MRFKALTFARFLVGYSLSGYIGLEKPFSIGGQMRFSILVAVDRKTTIKVLVKGWFSGN